MASSEGQSIASMRIRLEELINPRVTVRKILCLHYLFNYG